MASETSSLDRGEPTVGPAASEWIELPNSTLPPGWAERGWKVMRIGRVECFVFDGRANIEAVRRRVDCRYRPHRSFLAELKLGLKSLFDHPSTER